MPAATTKIDELISRWDSGEGKPYKGALIDWSSYGGDGHEPPADLGCMCAQGQVLHVIGGMEPKAIHDTEQEDADKLTASLLNISRAHAVLLRSINDRVDGAPSIVLTDPGKVLGDQWSKLLDFWWHLDQMTPTDWDAARAAGAAAGAAGDAARVARAAGAAAGAAGDAARVARVARVARATAGDAAGAAAGASNEIQGAALMRERDKPFFFLPLFGFSDPEAIPARPANYGKAA